MKRINKMNGYTKMKNRSIIKESSSSPPSDSHTDHLQDSTNEEETKNDQNTSPLPNENKPPSSGGAPKFQRISSVSSSRPTMAIQTSSVRRNFSMKRSRSVSERYCRIHDQHLVISSSSLIDGGDEGESKDDGSDDFRSDMKEKKNGNGGKRILKACKRIFRF